MNSEFYESRLWYLRVYELNGWLSYEEKSL
jgi:hypothetical protein